MSGVDPGLAHAPTCEICGREWGLEKDPEEWIGVEVDHAGGRLHAAFCSRDHAQTYFSRPLPDPPRRVPPPPLQRGERTLIAGVGVLSVLATAVFVIGLVTVVTTVAGWL